MTFAPLVLLLSVAGEFAIDTTEDRCAAEAWLEPVRLDEMLYETRAVRTRNYAYELPMDQVCLDRHFEFYIPAVSTCALTLQWLAIWHTAGGRDVSAAGSPQ
jgi:hypothetical protein